jgi:hypothetical protein
MEQSLRKGHIVGDIRDTGKRDLYFLAIDVGAGQGTRIALFHNNSENKIAETQVKLVDYGETYRSFFSILTATVEEFLHENGIAEDKLSAIGIATPGILRADGGFQMVHNLPHFIDYNLRKDLSAHFEVPVGIENDANAGGLAEWSVLRIELLYWVFGGGWGGAWISATGQVRFPVRDWDGDDASLHFTNEPGFSIPLDKIVLKSLFNEVNASYERLERVLLEDFKPKDGKILGPCDDEESIRAELILSGPGRCRLFRAVVGDDDFYERFLDIHETKQMSDPAVAGRYISKLSSMRVEAAVNTDRLYGKILATATRTMIKAAEQQGMPEGIPICLGGKPSYALPYFGPSAQRVLGKYGMMNYLRPSIIDERGSNANLVGASVVAMQAYHAALVKETV